jgi:hypothetical protein
MIVVAVEEVLLYDMASQKELARDKIQVYFTSGM